MEINKDLKIRTVGVGAMGMSLVQGLAQSGFTVIGVDIDPINLEKGLERTEANLEAMVAKGKLSDAERRATLARITLTQDMSAASDAEVVIESVYEDLELKKRVFAELDRLVASPDALLLTNTSSLSVTGIASATKRPDRVAGTHFFNPVPFMPLVEVVRAARTSDSTMDQVLEFVALMGKQAVISADSPGFVVNRMFNALFLEAARLVQEGAATVEDVDACCRLGLGHVIGPFQLVDRLGFGVHMKAALAYMAGTLGERFFMPVWVSNSLTAGRPFCRKTIREDDP